MQQQARSGGPLICYPESDRRPRAITAILVLFPVRSHGHIWQDAPPSWEILAATGAGLLISVGVAEFPATQAIFGYVWLSPVTQLAIFGYSLLYVAIAEFLLLAYHRHPE